MRVAVIDSLFWPHDQLGAGAQLVSRHLPEGLQLTSVEDAEVVLCRAEVPDATKKIARIRSKVSVPLVVGGPASYHPAALADCCDAVICGDYRAALEQLRDGGMNGLCDAPNVFVANETRPVEIDHSFP